MAGVGSCASPQSSFRAPRTALTLLTRSSPEESLAPALLEDPGASPNLRGGSAPRGPARASAARASERIPEAAPTHTRGPRGGAYLRGL
eukprot:5430979-Alexandrium_andersonii.AAC.1